MIHSIEKLTVKLLARIDKCYSHFFEMGFARIDRCYFSLKWNLDKVFLLAVFAHRQMLFLVQKEFRQVSCSSVYAQRHLLFLVEMETS